MKESVPRAQRNKAAQWVGVAVFLMIIFIFGFLVAWVPNHCSW